MATALDVAAYILGVKGPMTAMKLQKLVYYSQAWHLVWDEKPLFTDRIEAWANGPVVPVLYAQHRGRFALQRQERLGGDPTALTESERETIDLVLGGYGNATAQWLSELTHQEAPWRNARAEAGLAEMQRGSAVIEPAAMHEFYTSLTSENSEELG